jgi:hypothetical protein
MCKQVVEVSRFFLVIIKFCNVDIEMIMFCIYLELRFAGACQYWGSKTERLFTLEFDRLRKSMSVIVKEQDSPTGNKLLVKVLF